MSARQFIGCRKAAPTTQAPTPPPDTAPAPSGPASSTQGGGEACSADVLTMPTLPAGAKAQILCHPGHLTAFNPATRLAWYSAEHLTVQEMSGQLERRDHFESDPTLPSDEQVYPSTYTRSGYDRGHLAPSADYKGDEEAMTASYLTSNVAPQNPTLNREAWAALESATRDCARRQGGAYVLTGIIVPPDAPRIGKGQWTIPVPSHFFKFVTDGQQYRAFVYPNEAVGRGTPFKDYEVTQQAFIQQTGIDPTPRTTLKGGLCTGSYGR